MLQTLEIAYVIGHRAMGCRSINSIGQKRGFGHRGTISASNLPTALYSLGQEGSMVGIYEINISGSLKVTTPTCNITTGSQSMTVKMGSYHTSDFSGPGTVPPGKMPVYTLTTVAGFTVTLQRPLPPSMVRKMCQLKH
jgi:hypothetical protein